MSDPDATDGERPFSALPKPEPVEPAPPTKDARPRRRLLDMPEAGLGWFILWLLAAAGGALIVIAWQWWGGGATDNLGVNDRLAALETRLGQIAVGQAPKAAVASFAEERRNLATLKERVDADEARLSALESSADRPSGQATGQTGGNTAAQKVLLDKSVSELAQRLTKLEQAGPAPQLGEKVAANEKALESLRADLDARSKATSEALDKVGSRVADIEQHLPPADLAERLDSFALKSGVAALETRLAKLESQDTAGLIRRATAVLALADFVRASERAEPFANELVALRALVPASPEIADLSQYAKKGVPTVAALAQRFPHDIDHILAAERTARARNWAERLWFDFVNLVSVRRVGNIAGNDTEARVARAEFALKTGNLAAAVAEVRSLDAPARAAAAPWLKDAEARLAINSDARSLTGRIVTGLASAAQSDAPQ